MTAGEIAQHRREMRWIESQRRGDAQAPADLAVGRDRLTRGVELSHDPGGIFPEARTRFRERRAACGSGEQLRAEMLFQPHEAPAHDGLWQAESASRRRHAAGVGDLYESAQILQIQHCVPV